RHYAHHDPNRQYTGTARPDSLPARRVNSRSRRKTGGWAMTKKKAASRTVQADQVLERLQKNMKRLQRDADQVLGRLQPPSHVIPPDQRRALTRLLNQAQRVRADLEKRAQWASKQVEARAEQFLSRLERRAAKRLRPILQSLDLPSRK